MCEGTLYRKSLSDYSQAVEDVIKVSAFGMSRWKRKSLIEAGHGSQVIQMACAALTALLCAAI